MNEQLEDAGQSGGIRQMLAGLQLIEAELT